MALLIDTKQSGSGSQIFVLYAKEQMALREGADGEVWENRIGEYKTLRGLVRAIAGYYQIELDRKIR